MQVDWSRAAPLAVDAHCWLAPEFNEPRASRVPALAISTDEDALFAARIGLHIQAIRAMPSDAPVVAPSP